MKKTNNLFKNKWFYIILIMFVIGIMLYNFYSKIPLKTRYMIFCTNRIIKKIYPDVVKYLAKKHKKDEIEIRKCLNKKEKGIFFLIKELDSSENFYMADSIALVISSMEKYAKPAIPKLINLLEIQSEEPRLFIKMALIKISQYCSLQKHLSVGLSHTNLKIRAGCTELLSDLPNLANDRILKIMFLNLNSQNQNNSWNFLQSNLRKVTAITLGKMIIKEDLIVLELKKRKIVERDLVVKNEIEIALKRLE